MLDFDLRQVDVDCSHVALNPIGGDPAQIVSRSETGRYCCKSGSAPSQSFLLNRMDRKNYVTLIAGWLIAALVSILAAPP